ncbi:MAG TPA: hypothetical protein VF609_00075 [Flavisolibacter sp.]|jgi:hypothetical protein
MYRAALVFVLLSGLIACKDDDKKTGQQEEGNSAKSMTGLFKEVKPPYQLSDTELLKNSDTTTLSAAFTSLLLPDSIKKNYFGKSAKIKFSPLAKLDGKDEMYYVIKAAAGAKKAALLAMFDEADNFLASYPFLLPDTDANTSQSSTIDKNFTITKTITQRNGPDVTAEGKEVVAYDAAEKKFGLIMLDALNENMAEIVSPIDTFPKTNKLAGDYWMNKKNLISIRDGRYPNQLLVYVHTENKAGDCKGELRGEFLITSSTTATYRQGGDPCVLDLIFQGTGVSISEQTGCGNYRGLDCPLSGTFTRKKPSSAKQSSEKPKRK